MSWKVTAAVAVRIAKKGPRVLVVKFDPWQYETEQFVKHMNTENRKRRGKP